MITQEAQTEATNSEASPVDAQASGQAFDKTEEHYRDQLAQSIHTAGRLVMAGAELHKLTIQAALTVPVTPEIAESTAAYANSVRDVGQWLLNLAATIKAA